MGSEGQPDRLAELILYLAKRSEDDPWFGKVKLAKLLAFTDFHAFGHCRRPVTGATYVKLPEGPVPSEFYSALQRLCQSGRARVEPAEVEGGHVQERVVALDDAADLSDLDRYFADEILRDLRRYNAGQLSELAHRQFVGWRMARMKDPIPYESYFISPLRPTANEIRQGLDLYEEAMRGAS